MVRPNKPKIFSKATGNSTITPSSQTKPSTFESRAVSSIYLDFNASTPIAPEAVDAMRPFLKTAHGNPSSGHWAGAPAWEAIVTARQQIAALLGCATTEIVFTSGGSESNNLALKGLFFAQRGARDHIITSQIEHPSVIEPCRFLERLGAKVTYLPVDRTGLIDPDDVRRAITRRTFIVSIMHANNEVGTLQPISDIAAITRPRGIPFHTDAAQSVGKIPSMVDRLGVDLLSIAGHKVYAPKGVGALYIRSGLEIEPLIHGAGHEGGRRAGSESALVAVGLGKACQIAKSSIGMPEARRLRDALWQRLRAAFGKKVVLNGHPEQRLPNTLNVSFIDNVGSEILANLKSVAVSTGSACHAGQGEISPVLNAMGVAPEVAAGAIRFSLGRTTTEAEIEEVVVLLQNEIR